MNGIVRMPMWAFLAGAACYAVISELLFITTSAGWTAYVFYGVVGTLFFSALLLAAGILAAVRRVGRAVVSIYALRSVVAVQVFALLFTYGDQGDGPGSFNFFEVMLGLNGPATMPGHGPLLGPLAFFCALAAAAVFAVYVVLWMADVYHRSAAELGIRDEDIAEVVQLPLSRDGRFALICFAPYGAIGAWMIPVAAQTQALSKTWIAMTLAIIIAVLGMYLGVRAFARARGGLAHFSALYFGWLAALTPVVLIASYWFAGGSAVDEQVRGWALVLRHAQLAMFAAVAAHAVIVPWIVICIFLDRAFHRIWSQTGMR